MRLLILFGLATAVALWLQTDALHWLPTGPFVPDLIVILAVDLGLKHHSAIAPVLAFVMGYATDAFSGSQLGVNAFMITLIFLLSFEFSRHVWVGGRIIGPLTVLVAVLLKTVGVLALSSVITSSHELHPALVRALLLQALLTVAVSPVIFALLDAGKELLRLPVRAAQE